MVRLVDPPRAGFLVRRRRSDEPALLLDTAVVRLAEGQSGVLVELLPPGRRSVLPVDLCFVGVPPSAIPHRRADIAFGQLRAAGHSSVAAYRIALGRAPCLTPGRHQPLFRPRVLRYGDHLRRSGLYILLERVRVVRALSPRGVLAGLGPPGAGVWPVCGGAGCQGDLRAAARGRGAVRVILASARELEARGIVALDMP